MKKALILHGWEGTSKSNFFPWLKKELEKEGFKVLIPNLTNTDYPVYEEQYKDIKNIKLNPGDLIIGHSLGCKLAINFIEEKKIKQVNVILVAPVYNNLADELGEVVFGDAFYHLASYFNTQNNFRNINKLNNKYTIFLSDNDSYINIFSAKEYYSNLKNVEFIECKNKGHFLKGTGDFKFPKILKYIK